jgi:secondary thiamine-phosphate synthase enzyme
MPIRTCISISSTRWAAGAARSGYVHDTEGPDDMPAHIKSALTATSLSIPVRDGAMLLGTWQGIYVAEHRDRLHRREVALHYLGAFAAA